MPEKTQPTTQSEPQQKEPNDKPIGIPKLPNSPNVSEPSKSNITLPTFGSTPTTSNTNIGNTITETIVYYSSLNDSEKSEFFKENQLDKGIVINTKEDCVKNATKRAFTIDSQVTTSNLYIPKHTYETHNIVLKLNERISFYKEIHEIKKRGVVKVGKVGVSVAVVGISVGADASIEKEIASIKEKTETYILFECILPKVTILLSKDDMKASDEFVKAINKALEKKSSLDKYLALLDVFNEYGYYIVTKFTLGGKVLSEQHKIVNNSAELEREAYQLAPAFSGGFSVKGVPIKIEVEPGAVHYSNTNQNLNQKAETILAKEVIGGDGAAALFDVSKWVASLAPYKAWKIVKYDELIPIIDLLDDTLKANCVSVIDQHCLDSVTRKKTPLNMENYIATLKENLIGDLIDEFR